MDKQWVVFSHEEGLIGIFDNYDEALKEYKDSKDAYENYVYENGEHDPNEDIILAAINKRFYSYDTKNPTEDSATTTYWDFKEDCFSLNPIPLPTIKPGDKVYSVGWYCSICNVNVSPQHVTYQEEHDVRAGGCGGHVEWMEVSHD
ncbi:hypothetical protein V3851_04385 [Paenibacillus sp. M1]|uniref:Uncharacterized protein n=1 Tax=Paenibacillus haidiansis TaxID=1574488 RepID=A0ABU7VMR4_9BACL